jgi:uncharacterized protein YxeA
MSDHNGTPKTLWWQNKKIVAGIAIILVAVVALIIAAYTFHWNWTELQRYQRYHKEQNRKNTNNQSKMQIPHTEVRTLLKCYLYGTTYLSA